MRYGKRFLVVSVFFAIVVLSTNLSSAAELKIALMQAQAGEARKY